MSKIHVEIPQMKNSVGSKGKESTECSTKKNDLTKRTR